MRVTWRERMGGRELTEGLGTEYWYGYAMQNLGSYRDKGGEGLDVLDGELDG